MQRKRTAEYAVLSARSDPGYTFTRLMPTRLMPTRLMPTRLIPTLLMPTLLMPTLLIPTLLMPTLLIPTLLIPTLLIPTLLIPTLLIPTRLIPGLPVTSGLTTRAFLVAVRLLINDFFWIAIFEFLSGSVDFCFPATLVLIASAVPKSRAGDWSGAAMQNQ